ncbi:MAG: hypothetical protein ACQCN4_03020 [Candidatus Bathyarchaeia archaeon]|jgi:hypothetical protein
MNWKNVLYLLRVERKSGRLVRGVKATRYREHGIVAYWPYWVAAVIGVVGGYIANIITEAAYASASEIPGGLPPIAELANGAFVTVPTLILLASIVFTLLQQIQLAGIKKSAQVMYWLPVTWKEHTMASILANLLGFPIAIVIGVSAGLIVFSAFNGLIISALVTSLAMIGAALMGSSTTEILRILQVRFTGAVYKSSGRAAIYIRLIGSLLFFLIFYLIYFSIFTGSGSLVLIQTIASFQTFLWYIPFVWLGIALYHILLSANIVLGIAFLAASAGFIAALYYIAVYLNQRFGLYEPPAIKVQTSGLYQPKEGLLGKLGFTNTEAAIIRKDARAFTRRRELLGVFIVPIVFMIVPIFNTMNGVNQGAPQELDYLFGGMLFILPAAFLAMLLSNMMIGEEGPSVWRIYAAPISPKNLVKSKYAFTVLFAIIVQIVAAVVGFLYFRPSLEIMVIAVLEGFYLIFALASMGLTFGFKGADFTVSRRQRMIRQEWALISMLACALAGLAILAPLAPFAFSSLSGFLPFSFPSIGVEGLAICLGVSGVIAAVIAAVFYKINLGAATELIRKAEI